MLPIRVALPRTFAAVVPVLTGGAVMPNNHARPYTTTAPKFNAAAAAAMHAAPEMKLGRPVQAMPGDWRCEGCGASNFARRQRCYKCARDKNAPSVASASSMSTAEPTVKTSSDWLCHLCQTSNFASRTDCFMCNVARQTAPSSSAIIDAHAEETEMIRINDVADHGSDQIPRAALASSGSLGTTRSGKGAQALKKKGDWTCGSCKAHNFASREACFSCAAPKTAAESIVTESEPSALRSNGFNKKFAQMPGDWLCTGCGVHNFRNRESCRGCNVAKEGNAKVLSTEDAMMPGDWKCPNCSEMNFRKRELCRACAIPKPQAAEGAAVKHESAASE